MNNPVLLSESFERAAYSLIRAFENGINTGNFDHSVERLGQFVDRFEATVDRHVESLDKPRDDGALAFLKRASEGKHRIVSSGDLTSLQIAWAQANDLFYVEPGGGLGWVLLPWARCTHKDQLREARDA